MEYLIDRFSEGEWTSLDDSVSDEEPLQITVDGFPIAVVMRTRGHDRDLVHGFLITEGILSTVDQISRIDLEQKKNHALVFLKEDVEVDLAKLQRNLYSASSCGICGKASIEAICVSTTGFEKKIEIAPEVLLAAPDTLRNSQTMFDQTGGIHAAGVFTLSGELLVLREDVGRHNAVDKVIGWACAQQIQLDQCFLQVSGRVSFEVIQKALLARIPAVSAISAPSSLAVEFAQQMNMRLYGFVRGQRFNRYS